MRWKSNEDMTALFHRIWKIVIIIFETYSIRNVSVNILLHIYVESYNLSLLLHKNEKEGPQESCYVGGIATQEE